MVYTSTTKVRVLSNLRRTVLEDPMMWYLHFNHDEMLRMIYPAEKQGEGINEGVMWMMAYIVHQIVAGNIDIGSDPDNVIKYTLKGDVQQTQSGDGKIEYICDDDENVTTDFCIRSFTTVMKELTGYKHFMTFESKSSLDDTDDTEADDSATVSLSLNKGIEGDILFNETFMITVPGAKATIKAVIDKLRDEDIYDCDDLDETYNVKFDIERKMSCVITSSRTTPKPKTNESDAPDGPETSDSP